MPYPNIDPVFLRLGPLQFRWYGLMYLLALTAAYFVIKGRSAARGVKITKDQLYDLIVYSAVGVFLGGRLGYVLFYNLPYYLDHPSKIIAVWEGGMSFHGGLLGTILAILLFCRRRGLPPYTVADMAAVAVPIGLGLGRIGNFINGELYGRITKVPWAMQFPKELFDHPQETERAAAACASIDPSLTTPDAIVSAARSQPRVVNALRPILSPRHPSQLYEAFFEGIVLFAILWWVRTRARQPNGVLTGLFFICYAVFRIVIENFREPDAELIGPFTRGQFFSFFLIAIGAAFIVAARMKPAYPKNIRA
ncbi:MAG: prolipoprotein diacylglyceryl transferase [Nitrospiraceae bacterium]